MVEPSITPSRSGSASASPNGEHDWEGGGYGSAHTDYFKLEAETASEEYEFDHWEIERHRHHVWMLNGKPSQVIDETFTDISYANPYTHDVTSDYSASVQAGANDGHFEVTGGTRAGSYGTDTVTSIVAHFRQLCITKINCEVSNLDHGGTVTPKKFSPITHRTIGARGTVGIRADPENHKLFKYWTQQGVNEHDGTSSEMPGAGFPFSNKRITSFHFTAVPGITTYTLSAHFREATDMPNCSVNGDIVFSDAHGDTNPVVGDY